MSSLLEHTLATSFVPATNLRQNFEPAGWLYLLPSLDLEVVLCIGAPTKGTLASFARRAGSVKVACLSASDLRQRDRALRNPDVDRVEWFDEGDPRVLSETQDGANLVVLVGPKGRREGLRRGDALRRTIGHGGSAYVEWTGASPQRSRDYPELRRLGKVRFFRLLPPRGETQVAVPEGDLDTLDYFMRRGIADRRLWPGLPRPVAKLLRRLPAFPAPGRRYGALVGDAASQAADGPPEYLRAVARKSGVALADYRWGLSVPGAYRSRKIMFYLFGPRASCPDYVAKMVSEPSLSGRLENEARALRELEGLGMADQGRIPRVTFSGQHAGLAIVGLTLIEGTPFRQKSSGGPTCPHAAAAFDALLELGKLTRRPDAATGAEVASAVGQLLNRFDAIYADREVGAFLREMVERLRRHTEPIPLVFQHGDPGTWNLLMTPSRTPTILDWESAEPAGLPLWDVFYYLRSYGVFSARRRGVRAALRAFELAFLDDSELSRWIRSAIARYCVTVGVAPALVAPLFHLCWMHRSVKEATRLEGRELNQGHYVNLLRLCMREQGSLERLLSLSR